ncbi:MAG: hypothetical protein HFF36_01375 [Coprobacillus sp.]|jgi:hypothetical protein|nr:hypothetical protein [Coprobacillus sp.]
MEKEKIELVEILEERFQHYEEVLENGCDDPLWADGLNLNLIRNHIIIAKRNIEEEFSIDEYPDVYYKKTPEKINDDYMVKADEIREKAKEVLMMFRSYPHLHELESASYYLDKNQLVNTGIEGALCLIKNLDEAMKEDNLVGMRRLSKNLDHKMKDFEKAFENLCEINMEEERQISLFEIMM